MRRFLIAVSSILLSGLVASPVATGQEPSKGDAPEKTVVADQIKPRLAEVTVTEGTSEGVLIELNELIGQAADQVVDPANSTFSHKLLTEDLKGGTKTQTYTVQTAAGRQYESKMIDVLEANFGLRLLGMDDALRAQLEIPPGHGVVVVAVKAGSLAADAGLKVNDVLLSLGDQKVTGVAQARKILLGLSREALGVQLIREGKPTRLSVVGPEHGFPPEPFEYWVGVPVSPVDSTLRTHLPTLASDSGLIVNEVVKGSPAEAVSIRKYDILVRMDGKSLKTPEALIEQIQASGGKPVPLEILRAGKPVTVTITPAKRSTPSVVNFKTTVMKGSPGSTQTYRVVRPNLAIEVDPKAGSDGKVEVKHMLSGKILRVDPASTQLPTQPAPKADFQLQFHANQELPTARIESQLKEVMAELEKITKALEGIKKPLEK